MHGNRRRSVLGAALGAGLGLLAGVGVLAAASGAGVSREATGPPRVEATHLPPLLTVPGEAVTLRYDVYCVGSDDPTAECDADGTVYVRAGDSGPYQVLPLRLDPTAVEGRYAVRVPAALAYSGFSYYALLRDARRGASTTVPEAGAAAPERSVPLGDSAITVDLGEHAFGGTRRADARIVSALWGDGSGKVGLEETGPNATPIGASSFDVDGSGRVTVLDEAHRRLLRFASGTAAPVAFPVAVDGTIADLSIGADGSAYVLESAASGGQGPVLRTFDAGGAQRSAVSVGRYAGAAVRIGPDGPVVLEPQSEQWRPAGSGGAFGPGRPVGGGLRVVVYRPDAGELRVATTSASGAVVRGWRIRSATPIGDVQLAEPAGGRLVVVLRVYTDARADYVVLVLGASGVVRQFSLDAADWAEAAPLSRFRLAGSSLYRLGSTPAGIFIDRFDLGVS